MARNVKNEQPERPLHYLREWREFRRLSQEALGAAIGTTKGVISLLEASAEPGREHKRGLSPKWAKRLAEPLRVQPGWLLDVDPNTVPTGLLEAWAAVPDDMRDQAMKTLVSFAKKATS